MKHYIIDINCSDDMSDEKLINILELYKGIQVNNIYRPITCTDKKIKNIENYFINKPNNIESNNVVKYTDDSTGWHDYNDISNMPIM